MSAKIIRGSDLANLVLPIYIRSSRVPFRLPPKFYVMVTSGACIRPGGFLGRQILTLYEWTTLNTLS